MARCGSHNLCCCAHIRYSKAIVDFRRTTTAATRACVPVLVHFHAWLPSVGAGPGTQFSKTLQGAYRCTDKYVPPQLLERPKMGFGVPIDSWLRGPLREWAEELLSESNLNRHGFFAVRPIRTKWEEHLSGTRNWQYLLWDVLVFQDWLHSTSHSPKQQSAPLADTSLASSSAS